ncbi:hypothetical protein MHBO_003963 [Bonamia ostreae]|uniref:Uncharacterized protein n=1 Tax=Bonamia ostreae TaxID=126728 RepID=A0ABV2AST2_9EUKA
MNTTLKDKFEKDEIRVRELVLKGIIHASETRNFCDLLRFTQNYLAVGGRLEDIEIITFKKDFEKLTHLLKSEFYNHPTRDPNLKKQTAEMFYANFYEKFKCVAIESSDKANFLGDACGLIDMFIPLIETIEKRPEFILPEITENSVLKYYVDQSLTLLNHEEVKIFPECYYENHEVSELKDKLVRFVHQEAKQSGFINTLNKTLFMNS